MLQINSGKLYPNGVGRKNQLRGAETIGSPTSIVYEITEQMESNEIASGVLISHGVLPYLHDFSAVVSFALRVTCTPDIDLCARLLSGKRSLSVISPPAKLVKRVFEKEVFCQATDNEFLISFVSDLIGLRRRSFLAAMKAIRTYVTGLHRIADDHEGAWNDFEESKRRKIDKALSDADGTTAERVRSAIVEIEHLALSRRFRDFALKHISPAYFREAGRVGAPGRLDMRDALKEAYSLRSRYVHNLNRLPHLLS